MAGGSITSPPHEVIRIVLVDDHPMLRDGTQALLNRAPGMTVVGVAGDGASALSLVQSADPDLLVLDVHLPDMSGVEVARQIRLHHPNIKVLVLTGYDGAGYMRTLLQHGVQGYLAKTATGEQIIAAVRTIAAGHSLLLPDPQRGAGVTGVEDLTAREQEILQLVAAGKRNGEIADQLVVSVKTVEFHMHNLFEKLGVRSRAEAIRKALQEGLC